MLKTLLYFFETLWVAANTRVLKFKIFVNCFCGLISGISLYYSSYYLSLLVKNIVDGNSENLLNYLYIFIGLAVIVIASRFVFRFFTESMGVILGNNFKKHYFEKIFYKDYYWHTENSTGYISSMIGKVASLLESWNWKLPYEYFPGIVLACFFISYTYSVSFYLFLYFVISLIFLVVIIRLSLIKRMKLDREKSHKSSIFNKVFIDFLYNIKTVKKMNVLNFTKKVINQNSEEMENCNSNVMKYNAWQWFFVEAFVRVIFLVPLTYFILNLIKTGEGVDVIVMLVSIQAKMEEMARLAIHFMSELARVKQDFELLILCISENETVSNDKVEKKNWESIKFKNTLFRYFHDKENSLEDNAVKRMFEHKVDNLIIKKGDHIAVVGESGEGKSTFLNLLTRQYFTEKGNILIDNVDYKKVMQSFFDENFAYVSQDIELFNMSLYDNIAMGKNLTDEEMKKIIKGCCLEQLVKRMGGLHCNIGEKGIKISGGEKQRLNLARGLVLSRDVLILDEITANLDPKTAKLIWSFVFEEYKDKTVIAISHEDSLLKHVNKKLHFKKGVGALV